MSGKIVISLLGIGALLGLASCEGADKYQRKDQSGYECPRLKDACIDQLVCGAVFSKNDVFAVKGVGFQYKGADKVTATAPKIKLKNLNTGETHEFSVNPNDPSFVLRSEGISYRFEDASSALSNDWDIRYVCD